LHALKLSQPSDILVEKALLPRLAAAIKMLPSPHVSLTLHIWDSDHAELGVAQVLRVEHIIQHGSADFEPTAVPPGLAEKQLAFICFSSGTSGMVKGVRLSHGNIVANIFMQSQGLRGMFTSETVVALIVPFFHILGLAGFSCQYVCQVIIKSITIPRTVLTLNLKGRPYCCFPQV
jgi:4-coumarate--CoA ligase